MLFRKPDFDLPDIPLDITSISDERTMELFAAFIAWQNFAAAELAEAEVKEESAEAQVRYIQAKKLVESWDNPKDDRVTVAKAQRDTDPEVVHAQQAHLVARAHRKMLGVIYGNCDRSAALVSREITRRVGREPYERRLNRMHP